MKPRKTAAKRSNQPRCDVPDWFDLKKYEASAGFDLNDWRHNLYKRYGFRAALSLGREIYDDIDTRKLRGDAAQAIGVEPKEDALTLELNDHFAEPAQKAVSQGKNFLQTPKLVYDMPIVDVFEGGRDFAFSAPKMLDARAACEAYLEAFRKVYESTSPDALSDVPDPLGVAKKSYHELIFSELGRNEAVRLYVNLQGTDEELLGAFKAWLDKKRGVVGREVPNKKVATWTKRWREHNVLAFIDLELYRDHFKVPLADWQIGELILPSQQARNLKRKINDVVRPLAAMLMKHEFMRDFDARAVSQLAKPTKPQKKPSASQAKK